MRLWHKCLTPVLPRAQLVAQWRELSAIAGNILTRGMPNHILVNKVMIYSYDHFITYAKMIRTEMASRGYRTMDYYPLFPPDKVKICSSSISILRMISL